MELYEQYSPDFLTIGAGKSGTTSLNNYLEQHPDIFFSKRKETNFFSYELMNPADFKEKEELEYYKNSIINIEEYLNLFIHIPPNKIKGEASNTYLYNPNAANRIKHYFPNIKLIAIVRQPADRLYSRYLHLLRENRKDEVNTFSELLNKESIWWRRSDLIEEGFYYKHLKKYYEIFPIENIKVIVYDEFRSNVNEVMNNVYKFLNVYDSFKPNTTVKLNQSGVIRNKRIDKLIGGKSIILKPFKLLLPSLYYKTKNNLAIRSWLNNLRSKNMVKPKPDSELMRYLTLDVYKDDILLLQDLIQKDLSNWITKWN